MILGRARDSQDRFTVVGRGCENIWPNKYIAVNPFWDWVNLSTEFVNLYFPYAGRGLLFFAGGSGILNSNQHMWQWKEEAMSKIHMCEFKSHFRQDFLAYCTRPVTNSKHWFTTSFLGGRCRASQCTFGDGVCWLLVWQFLIFSFNLKQQNLMKTMFSSIHFPIWTHLPKIMIF